MSQVTRSKTQTKHDSTEKVSAPSGRTIGVPPATKTKAAPRLTQVKVSATVKAKGKATRFEYSPEMSDSQRDEVDLMNANLENGLRARQAKVIVANMQRDSATDDNRRGNIGGAGNGDPDDSDEDDDEDGEDIYANNTFNVGGNANGNDGGNPGGNPGGGGDGGGGDDYAADQPNEVADPFVVLMAQWEHHFTRNGGNQLMKIALMECGLVEELPYRLALALDSVENVARLSANGGDKYEKFINNFMKNNSSGDYTFSSVAYSNLFAFAHICKDVFRRGKITLRTDSVTQRTLRRANMELESDIEKREEMKKVELPPKVKSTMVWLEWREAFYTYLHTQLGSLDVPLLYVIIDPIEFTRMCDNNLSDEDSMIISANLCREDMYHEASYVKDNRKVRQILKLLLDKSPSSDLCKDNKDDGRAVYNLLAERIGNLADDQQYCTQASNNMDKLFYREENSMSFLDYVNRFNSNMHLYHLGGQEFTETTKLSILLDKIRVAEGNPIRVTVRNIKCDHNLLHGVWNEHHRHYSVCKHRGNFCDWYPTCPCRSCLRDLYLRWNQEARYQVLQELTIPFRSSKAFLHFGYSD